VAVKKFNMSSLEMDKLVKSSPGREMKALIELDHENVIKLLGLATNQSQPCIILEYADGDTLHHLLHGG
jgi:serine/threonine protein kinase